MDSEKVLREYRECKDKLTKLKSLRDKLEGQEEGIHEIMNQKFNVKCVEEGEILLDKLEKERDKLLDNLEELIEKMKSIIQDAENAKLSF